MTQIFITLDLIYSLLINKKKHKNVFILNKNKINLGIILQIRV